MNRYDQGKRITIITIISNILLAILKLLAGVLASSTAMIADGVHTLSDVVSSVTVIMGLSVSSKPRDEEHPYGHEKAESLASLVLALLLIATGLGILRSALELIWTGDYGRPGVLALYAAVLSIIVKEAQFRFTIRVAKATNSSALLADAWHHRSDALSSVGTLLGVGGAYFGLYILDPIAGIVVSIMVLSVGYKVLRQGFKELMDTSLSKDRVDILRDIVRSTKGVCEVGSIRTRIHGTGAYVDVKIGVDKSISVLNGHDIAHEVLDRLKSQEGIIDAMVHVDPCMEDCTKHRG